jgi:hypothetical protein
MKQAARTATDLSIVPSASSPEDGSDSLNEFFSGWLDSVAPQLSRVKPPTMRARTPTNRQLLVSSTEMVRVNRATVRESTAHRHWPPEVVAQFLQAEVIRNKSKSTRSWLNSAPRPKTNDNEFPLHDLVSDPERPVEKNAKVEALFFLSGSARFLLSRRGGGNQNMYSSKTRNGFWGIFLAFSLLLGVGLTTVSSTQAQDRRWERNGEHDRDDNDRHRGNRDRRDRDRDHDRNRDRDRNRDNSRWNRNNSGQYGGYGNYGQYRRNQGGFGNYGYNGYQQAQQQGYRDGLYTGSSDAQRGQSYNPQRSHYYKNANSGYNSSYGNRGQSQQAYRQGFLQGYQQGYQQYGGYNNNSSRRWPW